MALGNKSSSLIPSVRDRKSISQSGTRRRCNSRFAKESRLMLQPRNWSFVANSSWDQPFFVRHFFTCGPTKFSVAFVTIATLRNYRGSDVLTLTHHEKQKSCVQTLNGFTTVAGLHENREIGTHHCPRILGVRGESLLPSKFNLCCPSAEKSTRPRKKEAY